MIKPSVPKVSIILPTFNAEKTIKTTLSSINSQSYENIENIIIDGFSTDNTIKIVEENLHNFKVFQFEPKGIYDAINHGIKQAKGEYIFILNSDDFISFNAIKHLIESMIKNKVSVMWLPTYSNRGYSFRLNLNMIWFGVDQSFFAHSASLMVKQEIHKKYGLYNTKIKNFEADHLFFYTLFNKGEKLSVAEKSQAAYGVFTLGGISESMTYISKMLNEYKYRKKNKLKNINDFIYCFISFPIRLIWGFLKFKLFLNMKKLFS